MKYIKAGSTFLQKAKDIDKILRLNMKIYSESSDELRWVQMLSSLVLK